jgi:hypothetical protein
MICILSESRFPKLLNVKENRKKEWKDWKSGSRAQGRCATRLRYAPTEFILHHFRS